MSKPDITEVLRDLMAGRKGAREELQPLVYEELRRLARRRLEQEQPGPTLQPTALVHEAYLRLLGPVDQEWNNRAHFFGAAAEAMRRVLIDHVRSKNRIKRGGDQVFSVRLDPDQVAETEADEFLALDAALSRLEEVDPLKAEVVKLRFYGGLTIQEVARALDISHRSAQRYWAFARAWLYREVSDRSS